VERDARRLSLVLIEPQSCFAGAFARFLSAFAPGAAIRTFASLEDAGPAIREADAVVVDLDPGRLVPLSAAAAVSACGGIAKFGLSSSPADPVVDEAAGPLRGGVRKDQPAAALARDILAVARRDARPGLAPAGWTDRRTPGGSLPFEGRDRRRGVAAGH
jgi:hypothetical protein